MQAKNEVELSSNTPSPVLVQSRDPVLSQMQSEGKSEGFISRSDISVGGFTPARGNF